MGVHSHRARYSAPRYLPLRETPDGHDVTSMYTSLRGGCKDFDLAFDQLQHLARLREELLVLAARAFKSWSSLLSPMACWGLNLTAACQVHLLDPWWNMSVEEQAMDRVHRLGSEREVEVLRYIAKGTIEERMLLLQERKQQLKDAAFKRETVTQMQQMRVEDILASNTKIYVLDAMYLLLLIFSLERRVPVRWLKTTCSVIACSVIAKCARYASWWMAKMPR
eukprot:scaffold140264_cov18-Tisochrysis_lutea.AAC.1